MLKVEALNPAGRAHNASQPLAGGGGLLSKNSIPAHGLWSRFRPFIPHSQVSPTVIICPPMLSGLNKTLIDDPITVCTLIHTRGF